MTELFSDTDDTLFSRVLANKDHVLQPYCIAVLPNRPSTQYNLKSQDAQERTNCKNTTPNWNWWRLYYVDAV